MTSTPSAYNFPPTVNASAFPPIFNTTQLTPTNLTRPGDNSREIFQAIYVSLMAFVIIAGLLGNVMVIATIASKKSMWTPCNLFITNIAICDLLVAILLTPARMAELFIGGWPLGAFLCQFFGPLQDVIVCISAFTHTVIALERHRGIVTPFKPKLSLRRAKITILVICFACYLLIGLPLALVLNEVDRKGVKSCRALWPSKTSRVIFEVYLVVVFILLPLITQTATYVKIVAAIKKEDCSTQTISRSGTVEQRRNQIRKKAHLVRMLIILVAIFQVCFIPRGVIMLVKEFTSVSYQKANQEVLTIANITSIVLFYLKHVLNPFVLFAMSTEFKKNCFPCRVLCVNKWGFVSTVSRYASHGSPNSDVTELKDQELKKLCDVNSPEMQRESNV